MKLSIICAPFENKSNFFFFTTREIYLKVNAADLLHFQRLWAETFKHCKFINTTKAPTLLETVQPVLPCF